MMGPGKYVLLDGRAWEVVELKEGGDLLLRDTDDPLKLKWVDYYLVEVIDPQRDPGALLEAMSTLYDDDVEPPEEGEAHVDEKNELF